MHSHSVERKARPARRVYTSWDEPTDPDYRLATSFENTDPGLSFGEDEITNVFVRVGALTVLATLGFFAGRWWTRRTNAPQKVTGDGAYQTGLDVLGAARA